LTVSEIREVVSNPLFDSLERFAFTGGEPTLREDIAGVAGIILDSRPKVERFGITTNGIEPSRVSRQIKNLLEVINGRAVQFTVAVSLDGYGDTHGKVRGVPGAFDRVNETIRLLNELRRQSPFNMYLNCVVQPMNIGELPRLREYARGMGLYLQVTPVYMHSVITEDENSKQKLEMNREQMAELEMFVTNPENGISPMWASFWEDYFRVIRGEKRKIPCALLNHGITLDADGTMYVCGTDEAMEYGNVRHAPVDRIWYSDEAKMMRENVKKEYCTYCTNACYLTFSYRYDFLYYARFLLKEEAGKLLRRG